MSIRLTETVKKGGCAAKLPAGDLKKVLSELKLMKPSNLLVGIDTLDDACLWDLEDGRLLIQTLDFFTPIVDDAQDFGAIAAANALSDIYAMGGKPATALSILAFPCTTLPLDILKPLMKGAIDKIHESGACLAGGHSIDDETLKLGFSVSGFVEKTKVWTNSRSQAGDLLLLTKPIGTGVITSALKSRAAKPHWIESAIQSMKTLNAVPELLSDIQVNAATDITGFSLTGHALQMAYASQVDFEINYTSIPKLDGALECLKAGVLNRAHRTNFQYVKESVHWGSLSENEINLCVDAQTSGGLLLSIPEYQSTEVLKRLRAKFGFASIIGRVTERKHDPKKSYIRFEK